MKTLHLVIHGRVQGEFAAVDAMVRWAQHPELAQVERVEIKPGAGYLRQF